MLTPVILSRDDNIFPPRNSASPLVVFEDNVYAKYVDKQLLRYSLTTRSWDTHIRLPPGTHADHSYITAVSKGLVVISSETVRQQHTFISINKMWIREGATWKPWDNVLPYASSHIICDNSNYIVAAAGCDNLLFVLYRELTGSVTQTYIIFYDFNTNQWKGPCQGFPLKDWVPSTITVIANESVLYAKVYCPAGGKPDFFIGHFSSTTDMQAAFCWKQIDSQNSIRDTSMMTMIGSRLCVVDLAFRGGLKLYSPFTDASGDMSLVEMDSSNEYDFESPLAGVAGLTDGSLLVMGKVHDQSYTKPSVQKFGSKGMLLKG